MYSRRDAAKLCGAAALLPLIGCGDPGQVDNLLNEKAWKMPEESSPHERTFMQWPVDTKPYGGRAYLEEVQGTIASIAKAISEYEPVVMLAAQKYHADILAETGGNIDVWDIPTNDLWARDSGPTFVTSSHSMAVMDYNFNGWGNKQKHDHDGAIATKIAHRLGIAHIDSGVVGEAGGLEFDGHGTIIAHASSWVNPNRNKTSDGQIADGLQNAVGARKTIWAPGVKGKDITDYHIDALARFVAPGRVLIQLPDNADGTDPWSIAAWETMRILEKSTDADGKPLELIVLPEPIDIRSQSDDFVASYVNYYLCNGAVIAAQFGDDAADEKARSTLQSLYPDRKIMLLNVDPVGESGGGIHCATQQQPRFKADSPIAVETEQ
jgi:agmatine deiminase